MSRSSRISGATLDTTDKCSDLTMKNRPGLFTAVFFIAGIILYEYSAEYLSYIGIAAIIALTVLLISLKKTGIFSGIAAAILVLAFGWFRMYAAGPEYDPTNHITKLDVYGKPCKIEGWISEHEVTAAGLQRLYIRLIGIHSEGKRYAPVNGGIILSTDQDSLEAKYNLG